MGKSDKKWVNTGVPGWVRKVVRDYQKQLETYFGMGFHLEPETLYGCGHFGCVFPSSQPEWVLKITRDPTEGPVAQFISELENDFSAFVKYHPKGVVKLTDMYFRGKSWPIYAYVRENVLPVGSLWGYRSPLYEQVEKSYPKDYERVSRDIHNGLVALNAVLISARNLQKLRNKKTTKEWTLQQAEDKWEDAIHGLYRYHPMYHIAWAIGDLYRHYDIVLTDVHSNNVGVPLYAMGDRDPTLPFPYFRNVIIFDPGHTQIPVPIEIPHIEKALTVGGKVEDYRGLKDYLDSPERKIISHSRIDFEGEDLLDPGIRHLSRFDPYKTQKKLEEIPREQQDPEMLAADPRIQEAFIATEFEVAFAILIEDFTEIVVLYTLAEIFYGYADDEIKELLDNILDFIDEAVSRNVDLSHDGLEEAADSIMSEVTRKLVGCLQESVSIAPQRSIIHLLWSPTGYNFERLLARIYSEQHRKTIYLREPALGYVTPEYVDFATGFLEELKRELNRNAKKLYPY